MAFFAMTMLYSYIKNITAGIDVTGKLVPKDKNNYKTSIFVCIGEANQFRKELKFKNNRREIAKVPIPSKLFGDSNTISVKVQWAASGYVTQEEVVNVKRGEFPSCTLQVSLSKQGSNQVGETNVKQTKKTVEGAKPEKSCIYDGGCVENPIVGKGKIPVGRDCGENEKKENSQNKIICFKGDNGLFGFKDERGKIIIPCVWKCVSPYSEGMAAVENEAGLWGFIDKTGKNVIPCVWKKSKHFRNGLAAVSNDAVLWGFIDKTGKIILPIKWKIKNHIDGYWLSKYVEVTDENDIEYQIINEKGELRKKSTTESVAPQKSITTLSTDSNEKKKKWKFISNYHEGFARVQDETGKWGVIDGKNNIISPCIWKDADYFRGGFARVQDETGKWGFIDKKNNIISPCIWKNADYFLGGFAGVQDETGKWGFIDEKNNIISPCIWKKVGWFCEGFAYVQDETGKWGFIDGKNNIISPCIWKNADCFREGFAPVQDETGKWGFIDKTGKNVIPCVWKKNYNFRNGLAAVSNDAVLWGFIDKTGKIILPIKWKIKNYIDGYLLSKYVEVTDENDIEYQIINEKGELRKKSTTGSVAPQKSITTLSTESNEKKKKWKFISEYHGGFAGVQDETGKWGFIDEKNNIISPCIWKNADYFLGGFAGVQDETGKWGFIDEKNNIISPCIWKKVGWFCEGFAYVQDETGKWGFIDGKNNIISPCIWKNADCFREGFAYVQDETGKWGFIDGKNNIISPCIWTEAGSFHEGLAYVRGETGLYGYIDKMGKQVVPLQWNKAHDFSCKRARVKNSMGKYGFIDTSGELVIPCKYLYADDFSFKGEAEVTTNWFECIIDTDGKIQRNAEYWAQFIHWLTLGLSICNGICSILSLLLFFVNGHSSFLEIFLWSSIISWILFVLFILWQPK